MLVNDGDDDDDDGDSNDNDDGSNKSLQASKQQNTQSKIDVTD